MTSSLVRRLDIDIAGEQEKKGKDKKDEEEEKGKERKPR